MGNLIVIIQYVLATVGAFALILQAVSKITGIRPGSRPHKRLSKLQAVVQTVVDALGVLALNVNAGGADARENSKDPDPRARNSNADREKIDGPPS